MKSRFLILLVLGTFAASSCWADWNQWRGPNRDGKAIGADLPDSWAEGFTPLKVWESETIPSDHYGGHGSVSISDGKVFAAVVWHRDEPTSTRTLSSREFSNLGYRSNDFSPELMAKFEETRLNLSPRLRGSALDEFSANWSKEHLSEDQLLRYDSWVAQRFKEGKTAIPWTDLEIVKTIVDQELESPEAFVAWVGEQKWNDPATPAKVIEAMPNTKMMANDVVLGLSLETGETLWKFEVAGHPTGRSSSSTPAVAGGTVFAMLSTHLYAIDAKTGEEKWKHPLPTARAVASSPMVAEGKVFVQAGSLWALDGETGEVVWESDTVRNNTSSPAIWKNFIICNDNQDLIGLDIESGEEKWRQPAGGQGSPAISGDHLAVIGNNFGLRTFRLSIEGAQEVWAKEFSTRRYNETPIVHDGHVYHLGGARHMCVDIETGEIKWEIERQSDISSPVFADGKLLVLENNGGFLAMIGADPAEYRSLGRTKVGSLKCPTPAISGSLVVVRSADRIVCYDLGKPAPSDS